MCQTPARREDQSDNRRATGPGGTTGGHKIRNRMESMASSPPPNWIKTQIRRVRSLGAFVGALVFYRAGSWLDKGMCWTPPNHSKTGQHPQPAGFEPTRPKPMDFKSIPLTTRARLLNGQCQKILVGYPCTTKQSPTLAKFVPRLCDVPACKALRSPIMASIV